MNNRLIKNVTWLAEVFSIQLPISIGEIAYGKFTSKLYVERAVVLYLDSICELSVSEEIVLTNGVKKCLKINMIEPDTKASNGEVNADNITTIILVDKSIF